MVCDKRLAREYFLISCTTETRAVIMITAIIFTGNPTDVQVLSEGRTGQERSQGKRDDGHQQRNYLP